MSHTRNFKSDSVSENSIYSLQSRFCGENNIYYSSLSDYVIHLQSQKNFFHGMSHANRSLKYIFVAIGLNYFIMINNLV